VEQLKHTGTSTWVDSRRDDVTVPVARRVEDTVVAGGPGKRSAYVPGWGLELSGG
jgi:hypothetical protein